MPSTKITNVTAVGLTVADFEAAEIFQCKRSTQANAAGFMNVEFRPIYRRSEQAVGCGLYGIFLKTVKMAIHLAAMFSRCVGGNIWQQ